MEWLQTFLNSKNSSITELLLITSALAVVLILIVWFFRRLSGTPARRATRNRVPRLSVTDITSIDDRRFLVLARRDNVEHLLLIGGPTDVVVESGIIRTQPASVARQPTTPPVAISETSASITQETGNERAGSAGAGAVAAGSIAAGATASAQKSKTEPVSNAKQDKAAEEGAPPDTVLNMVAELNEATQSPRTKPKIEPVVEKTPATQAAEKPPESTVGEPKIMISNPQPAREVETPPVLEVSVATDPRSQTQDRQTPQGEPALELDLEKAIAENLEEQLSKEKLELADTNAADGTNKQTETALEHPSLEPPRGPASQDVKQPGTHNKSTEAEDEMQKLLDELTAETKGPVQ